jgi:hypothetical protein
MNKTPIPFGPLVLWLPADVVTAAIAEAQAGTKSAPAQPPLVERGEDQYVDARELARRTGTSPRLWRARARAGETPHVRVGRRILFPLSVLDAQKAGATAPAAEGRPGSGEEVVAWKR